LIDAAIEDWSLRWFRSWRLVRQRLQFEGTSPAEPVVASGSCVLIRVFTANVEIIAGRALDIDLGRLNQTSDDQAVVGDFGERIVLDLVRALDAALAPRRPSTGDSSGAVVLELRDEEGRKILLIETTRAALAQTRRRSLKPDPGLRAPLHTIEAAIADVPVKLQARLGSSLVPIGEARRLTPGDIIVLDHALDEPLDLAGPEGTRIACATLEDTASPRSLRLQAAPRDSR